MLLTLQNTMYRSPRPHAHRNLLITVITVHDTAPRYGNNDHAHCQCAGPHPLFSRGAYGIPICLEEKLMYRISLFTTCTSQLVSYAGFPTKTPHGVISPRLISSSKYDPLLDPETVILEGVGLQVDLHLAAHPTSSLLLAANTHRDCHVTTHHGSHIPATYSPTQLRASLAHRTSFNAYCT